jgi:2-polyprenyl-3-methyl-5-hydroxy-6-metoxy-1,4-benzoquinol methylase
VSRSVLADRIAGLYRSRFLRGYVRAKIASDPLYAAVAERLRDGPLPILDIGCGVGLMEFYLRESGCVQPMLGLDHDEGKIREAQRVAASRYAGLTFEAADACRPLDGGSSVLLLDLLHYLRDDQQRELLERVADGVPPGGSVIVRDGIRDGSWRYRFTFAAEEFARLVRWLKADQLNFPRLASILEPFAARGFAAEVVPMWGGMPFNNYLFVFKREASGTMKS